MIQRVLYIVESGDFGPRDKVYALIADDGEYLYSHICSDKTFAKGDLHDRRLERQAELREKYGDYVVRWIGEDAMTETELLRRNNGWAQESKI